jgi:amino acid adenylation domain-containing protein/non-ribosomal peptide synthase protein (TIGR01720 family)
MEQGKFIFPTSYAQQQLWLVDQMTPGTSMNNMLTAKGFWGAFDIETLKRVLNEIVARHETLRTTFTAVDGQPMQIVTPQMEPPLPVLDLQSLTKVEQQQEVRRLARQEIRKPFDLERGPLFRVALLRLGANEHVLLVTMHHLISDAWSLDVLGREITVLYKAYGTGKSSPLPELPIQYADYACWQREWLTGEVFQNQLDYWKKQLAGAPPALELPTDRTRPPVPTFEGSRESRLLMKSLTEELKALSRREGVTLFMALLAAFQSLLHRYSRQDDIVVGSPVANRNRTEVEGMIGLFVNTLVLRTDLSGDPTFRDLLKRVREMASAAYAHQEIPFEKLVEELAPERHVSRTPLFQVMFVFQNNQANAKKHKGGAALSAYRLNQVDPGTAKFDLTLSIMETKRGLETSFKYSSDLFDRPTVSRMLGHFQTLVQAIVANPDQRVSQLQLLTPAEQDQLLVEWNQTDRDFGDPRAIHTWFESQVELTPDVIAAAFEDDQLTYSALNGRANQLAHYLQKLGLRPQQIVGLCMERCVEMVVALLGILKAGCAYVPLDPKYPRDRLSFILEDTRAPVVLTKQHVLGALRSLSARLICLDADWSPIGAMPWDNLGADTQPDHLMYVLYTSGSTGQPKGVTVEHQQLWNYTHAILERLEASGFSFAMVQPLTVDSCLTSIFPPLCSGGTLHVISEERAADADALAHYFQRHPVDCLKIAPSHLAALHTSSLAQQIMPRRRLIIGGEASRWDWVNSLPELNSEAIVFNHYGPTEATVGVLTYRVQPRQDGHRFSTTPLGRPLANTRIYLLDEHGQPVPIGVLGEIYIGGANVARGYLNRPELTAEKFIPDMFSSEGGKTLYKTGDQARYLPDGNLEFLSRSDDQVKIRGFRIELKEIEAVLRLHPEVREGIVLCRRDTPDSDRLVAYIVPGQAGTSNAEVRSFLSKHLPDYMLPAAFVRLDALPRTPHGKVDRQALPAPAPEATEQVHSYIAPRTRTERILAELWAQVLRLDSVGIHDNFFELGGDSILSIQIVARANQVGLRLSSKDIFHYQTIAELAPVVSFARSINAEQGTVTGLVPLSPIQRRFFSQHHPEPHHFNQSFLLKVRRDFDTVHLASVVQHMLAHHDALRLRFTRDETGWIQYNAGPDDNPPFSRVDLSALPEREQKKAMRAAAGSQQASLDLAAGPLVRVVFFDLGPQHPGRLLIIVHHLAVDGVSWRILLEDLQTAHAQLARGEVVKLPSKTTSFKFWAERLRDYAHSTELRQELAYWVAQSQKPVSRLPVDYPEGRLSNTMASARFISVSLNPEETLFLLREAPRAYRTQVNDILLTALVQAFSLWTGSRSLLISLEGHGREEIFDDVDVSRTVGWFTSVFPVWLDLAGAPNVGEALKTIKEQLRRVPRRGIGYGILRYLTSKEEIGEEWIGPQPEVSFNYLGQFDQVLSSAPMFAPARAVRSDKSAASSRPVDLQGGNRSGRGARDHIIDIIGTVRNGQLRLNCTYSEKIHRRSTIERLVAALREALQSVILHCRTERIRVQTPSDHPLAKLDQQKLDMLLEADPQIEQVYPLSPLQHGMLFQSVYAPDSGAYVEQYQRTFDGLDVKAYKQAWQRVTQRHAVLRTAFLWKGMAEPLQVVRRRVSLAWEHQDWRTLSLSQREARLEEYRLADRQRGFDMSEPPLMRMALMQVAEDRHEFTWSHHHILSDGWSTQLILREVNSYYKAFSRGRELRLKKPRRYQDYIGWLQHVDPALGESFWRKYLQGFAAPTLLPMDRVPAGSRTQDASDSECELVVSGSLTYALRDLARRHHLTLSTVFQAAWGLLLSRYSGDDDVVFGTVVSGRPADLAGVESMVGLFINTLPVRVRIPPEARLLSWLQEIQAQQVEAREYQHNSLTQIQGWSEVPRGLQLFESILVVENYKGAGSAKRGLRREVNIRMYEGVNYLTVVAIPGSELVLKVLYDSKRFEAPTITRMLRHLVTLFEGMLAVPDTHVCSLTPTNADERQQLLVDSNKTAVAFSQRDRCLHGLVEEQARRTPDKVAVVFEQQQLTYNQLNCRANQIAHHLKELGVGPDTLVGLFVDRSADMVAALLGVLKAGGAYVPLDPFFPQDRLAHMVEDSGMAVLITQHDLQEKLPTQRARIVYLDTDWDEVAKPTETAVTFPHASGESLAYVLYTSGSTGKPKGVQIPHSALVNFLLSMKREPGFTGADAILAVTTLSFDIAGLELYLPLITGGRLVIASREDTNDPARLLERMRDSHCTVMQATPATWRALIDAGWKGSANLRVLCGGESLPRDLAKELLSGCAELWNMYGPTETTIWSTIYRVTSADKPIPIGRPIANTQVFILDANRNLTPPGVVGELYIGGAGLARGYLHREELTQQRFIPSPFEAQARLYRTGDLGRWLTDGTLDCLGRVDDQVKIRGFRIELGEIEAVLGQHQAVRQAAVVARREGVDEKRLVAYVVAHEGMDPNWAEMRDFLGKQLPAYMVPAAFVKLDALPLTPNGKLDRRALPEPEIGRAQLQSFFVAPRNSAEKAVAGLWAEILGLPQVGVYDSFFELGGHSLLAMRMASRIRDIFNIELALRDIFESPTVAGIAQLIADRPHDSDHAVATIASVSRELYRLNVGSSAAGG